MSNHEIILAPETKVTVIGDIHEHNEQFDKLIDQIQPSTKHLIVSVGDIYNKGFGRNIGDKIVDKIRTLNGYVVQGNHEQRLLRQAKKSDEKISDQLNWIGKQPFSLTFLFANGTRLTVVHGGVKPGHTWSDLRRSTDFLYIRTLDENGEPIPLEWVNKDGQRILQASKKGRLWHNIYDGRFGYIASGHHAQLDGVPKFYGYSCNLDTACYVTGILTAQTFTEGGRAELLQVTGPISGSDRRI